MNRWMVSKDPKPGDLGHVEVYVPLKNGSNIQDHVKVMDKVLSIREDRLEVVFIASENSCVWIPKENFMVEF